MTKRALKLVLRSLDSDPGTAEGRRLQAALAASEELRDRRDRLLELRRAVADGAARSFRPGFAERVASRLKPAQQVAASRACPRVPRRVLASAAATALVLLAAWLCFAAGRVEVMPREAVFYAPCQTIDRLIQALE